MRKVLSPRAHVIQSTSDAVRTEQHTGGGTPTLENRLSQALLEGGSSPGNVYCKGVGVDLGSQRLSQVIKTQTQTVLELKWQCQEGPAPGYRDHRR